MRDLDAILPFGVELPSGWRIENRGDYWKIVKAYGHPLSGNKGQFNLHRWLLYEHMGRPISSSCVWCGYTLPWVTNYTPQYLHCVNVDHLDGNKKNNEIDNLSPACWWCNVNRSWAEKHNGFWSNWRKWMSEVHPVFRPQLIRIAIDSGIISEDYFNQKGAIED